MKIACFTNVLSLGGAEKAAGRWAWGLQKRGHQVTVLTLKDGPRRSEFEQQGLDVRILKPSADGIATALREIAPQVLHVHAPGHPHEGDVLGEALASLPQKIPVVQTNIFGHLWNPKEDAWTDFRLFISWTSCVQAARRVFRKLDNDFFRRNSVAVYPLDPLERSTPAEIAAFREHLGIADDEILFGRFSRPEPNKWTNLALDAFRLAAKQNPRIKLLLREPPPLITGQLRASPDADRFIILPATSNADELRLTMSALDVVLHTSSIGESFGYGIAEPMNLGKPVITHSVPWHDQAQIELARHGECGFVCSTPRTMADAILRLADHRDVSRQMGVVAQRHIRALADPETSLVRLEKTFEAVLAGRENPFAIEDLRRAQETTTYLDGHQFGHSLGEQLALRPRYWRTRFFEWRRAKRLAFASHPSNHERS